jgi:uncharacterized membrane protein|tara:strand:- start:997 stop:1533 length:537 start_codon:yes stop_codon:yes gene_type:complete
MENRKTKRKTAHARRSKGFPLHLSLLFSFFFLFFPFIRAFGLLDFLQQKDVSASAVPVPIHFLQERTGTLALSHILSLGVKSEGRSYESNAGLNDEISSSLETTDNRSNFFQLMIAAVVQVSKLVWKLKTLRLSVAPARPSIRIIPGVADFPFSFYNRLCQRLLLDYKKKKENEGIIR